MVRLPYPHPVTPFSPSFLYIFPILPPSKQPLLFLSSFNNNNNNNNKILLLLFPLPFQSIVTAHVPTIQLLTLLPSLETSQHHSFPPCFHALSLTTSLPWPCPSKYCTVLDVFHIHDHSLMVRPPWSWSLPLVTNMIAIFILHVLYFVPLEEKPHIRKHKKQVKKTHRAAIL